MNFKLKDLENIERRIIVENDISTINPYEQKANTQEININLSMRSNTKATVSPQEITKIQDPKF